MAESPQQTEEIILGSRLICSFINILLFGVLCLQAYLFFIRKEGSSRPSFLKYSVWAIMVLNLAHVICDIGDVYIFFVKDYGDTENLLANSKSAFGTTVILVSMTSNLIVDAWFTWRVWILAGKNIYILIGLGGGTVLTWMVGVATASISYLAPTFKTVTTESWIILLYLSLAIATGIAWTVLLSLSLKRIRSESKIVNTRSLLSYFLVYTVNTGLIAVLLLISSLIALLVIPASSLFYSLYIPYSPLYSNALLGSLNAREWYWNGRQIISIALTNIGTTIRTENISSFTRAGSDMDNLSKTIVHDSVTDAEAGLAIDVTTDVVKATL